MLIFLFAFFSLKTKSSLSWTTRWKAAEGMSSTCSCWSPCEFRGAGLCPPPEASLEAQGHGGNCTGGRNLTSLSGRGYCFDGDQMGKIERKVAVGKEELVYPNVHSHDLSCGIILTMSSCLLSQSMTDIDHEHHVRTHAVLRCQAQCPACIGSVSQVCSLVPTSPRGP